MHPRMLPRTTPERREKQMRALFRLAFQGMPLFSKIICPPIVHIEIYGLMELIE